MELNFKKIHKDAVIPSYADNGSSALDITCINFEQEFDRSGKLVLKYHTGLTVDIPKGYTAMLFMEDTAAEKSMILTNGVVVLDSNNKDEIVAKFKITTDALPTIYQPGEKFLKMVVVPYALVDVKVTVEENGTEIEETKADEVQQ